MVDMGQTYTLREKECHLHKGGLLLFEVENFAREQYLRLGAEDIVCRVCHRRLVRRM